MSSTGEATLPLRPLTVGELLDAGISLLRRHPLRLLGLAAALAVAEQLTLLPLRLAVHLVPPQYLPDWWGALGGFWLLLAAGAGTEVVAITLLGAAAARCAVPALLGPAAGGVRRVGPLRWAALVVLALVLGVGAALGFLLGVLGWIFLIVTTGLIAPVFAVDTRPRQGAGGPPRFPGAPGIPRPTAVAAPIGFWRAVGRGFGLTFRSGLRPGAVRLVNYLAWLLVRLALALGLIYTLRQVVDIRSPWWLGALAMTAFALADTVAYAAAGCLDAVMHLEARIRLEGLDIAVGSARRRGTPVADALLVPQAPTAVGTVGRPMLPPPAVGVPR